MPAETGYTAFLRDLPQDWQTAQLSAVAKVVGGGTPSRDVPGFWGGDIPWVTPGEVSGEVSAYLSETRERITAVGLAGSGATLLPAGSLMVTTRATLGARAINAVPMSTNQGFKSLVFESGTDAPFYYYLTDKLKPELKRRASGTTFLEVSGAELARIEVPVPPVRERRLIAEILTTLDSAIRQTESIIEKLKQVKQGLLHDLLTRGIDANGELRPPQSQAPHLYKDSPLGWIPSDWYGCRLSVACGLIRDGTHLPPVRVESGPLLLSVRNMKDGRLVMTDQDTRVADSFYQLMHKSWTIQKGDVLLAIVGATIGKLAVVGDLPKFTLQRSVAVLRGNPAVLRNPFLFASMSHQGFQDRLWARVNQTAQPGIYLDQLGELELAVPPLAEQDAAIKRLAAIDERLETERASLAKLRLQKCGLMDDLLTGRVRITPLLAGANSL